MIRKVAQCGLLSGAIWVWLGFASYANAQQALPAELCDGLAQMANLAMTNRQDGVDKNVLLKVLEKYDDSEFKPMMKGIIDTAYQLPVESDKQKAQQKIAQFTKQVRNFCLQARVPN